MTAHHISDEQLLEYVAGTCSSGASILVACHLTLCPACRSREERHLAVGAQLSSELSCDVQVDALLESTLSMLDAPSPQPVAQAFDRDGVLPGALAAHVGDFSTLPWSWVFPGVQVVELPVDADGMPLRLFRLRGGMRVPDHAHVGLETSLVLAGGFTDDDGHYQRGDVAIRAQAVHRQRIDPGEPCVVLVLADQPLVAKTLKGWLAGKLRRL